MAKKLPPTTYKIHQTVYLPDYRGDTVDRFSVESITIEITRAYSGEGGTIGDYVNEYYSSEDGDFRRIPAHNLCPSMAKARIKLEEYRKRFPTHKCSECGKLVAD